MTTGFIYKITHKVTGRCYIGQSKNCKCLKNRWNTHKKKRFPEELFSYEVLMKDVSVEKLNIYEMQFISYFDCHRNGYNKTVGGSGINTLYPDEETRRKQSEAQKNRPPISDETRRKMSEAHKGKSRSEEHCRKLSEAAKSRSEEYRRKQSEAQKNRPPISDETRRKMSEAQKGKIPWMKGKTHSEETKRKISETKTGSKHHIKEK